MQPAQGCREVCGKMGSRVDEIGGSNIKVHPKTRPKINKIKIIFESREDQKLHIYSIDPSTDTLRLDSTERYNGELSGFLKEVEFSIVPGLSSPFLN